MRIWREFAKDRYSGGVLRVLLTLAFVVQIGLAGRAAAAMAAPDPLSVLCASSPDGSHRPAESDRRHECPCAELCGAGAQLPAPPSPGDATGIPIRFAERVEIAVDHSLPVAATPVVGHHPARGPPSVPIRS